MSVWYLVYNGEKVGPMTKENLVAYHPGPDSLVWRPGMETWEPVYKIPELMELINGMNPTAEVFDNPAMQPPVMPASYGSGKDKTVAGILAILLGGLGVQYFYLGKIGGGLITILLNLVTCGLWSILTLVQGILMLTMTPQEFERKFVYTDKVLPLF